MNNHVSSWRLPCVYFLLKDKIIVYIGQTTRLKARVNYHRNQKMDFDEVRTKMYPEEKLLEYEVMWIHHFNPKYNVAHNHQKKVIYTTKLISIKNMKFRKLTLKSILGFGKYQTFTVARMIQNQQAFHLCQAYFNLSHISFNDEVLALLKITPEWYIKKPGVDKEKGNEFKRIVYPELWGNSEYRYSLMLRAKGLSYLKSSARNDHRKIYHQRFNQKP